MFSETTNAMMTTGITINQSTYDNEILALKSSDVAHGVTDFAETDTYASFSKNSASSGGLQMQGFSADTVGVRIRGTITSSNTTKGTSTGGAIMLTSHYKSGTGRTSLPADGNMVTFGDQDAVRFIFDVEGSAYADVEWTTYDTYNDLSLISDMEDTLLAMESPDQTPRRHTMEATGIIGKDSWHMENGKPKAMVNFSKLAMLHHGALIQTGDRFKLLEDRLEQTEAKLLLAETKLNRLEN